MVILNVCSFFVGVAMGLYSCLDVFFSLKQQLYKSLRRESCNHKKGFCELRFRVMAVDIVGQGSAEAALSLKPWGLRLFLSKVSNEMHTCAHDRDTESPSCTLQPWVPSSVSQHSQPFIVRHTAAHDPHTHSRPNQRILNMGEYKKDILSCACDCAQRW